ncbi:MAG: hypothetical protein ACSHWY_10915, partial [Octadecabacter sp.]
MTKLAAVASAVFMICGTTAAAQADLSVSEAQRLAFGMIERGQYSAALELVDTLQQDGRNQTATVYIARSRAQRGLGQTQDAVRDGRTAFRLADTPTEKYLAARSVAQAYSTANNRVMAQVWLRLASQYSPSEGAEALNRRDFNYVRSRNPISLNFNLAVRPTDNVNNAPTDNTYVANGYVFTDPTLFPISGVTIQNDSVLSYRLPATQTRFSELHLSYFSRRIILGSEAATIDPTLTANDFSQDRFSIAWDNNFRRLDRDWVIDTTFEAYSTWSAGDHIQNGLSFDAGYRWPVGEGQSVRIAGGLDSAHRLDNDQRSYESASAQVTWYGFFDGIGYFQTTAKYEDFNSDSFAIARKDWNVSGVYTLPNPILTADVSVIVRYGESQYDEPLYGPEARFDQTLSGTLATALPEVEVFGFIPVIELTRQRVKSNFARFDTDTANVGFTIQS